MNRPLCFVLMPFGTKKDPAGTVIDFNSIYDQLIAPSIVDAELEPIRADEEVVGGIIHKPMFERLILCQYAVADLTTANANVFYELGVRHAVRPFSTVPIFAEGPRLPFDVAPIRAMPYQLTKRGHPASVEKSREALSKLLKTARDSAIDSPVFQLVDGLPSVAIDHTKTDVFRQQVAYSKQRKQQLAAARKQGLDAVQAVEAELGQLADVEAGVVIDLYLSYRAVKGWTDMIALVDKMPLPLRLTVMVQEQLGLALNRASRGDEAEQVLKEVLQRHGPSSETYGLLGRVYKDRWEAAKDASAEALLGKAIQSYKKGFEADWRDAYPGINTVTLMEIKEPPDPEREKLKPLVRYAAERRIASGEPDYWDYATLLEIAVLESDETGANAALAQVLACLRESWEAETTLRNLRLIRAARAKRGISIPWTDKIDRELAAKASKEI
jgi:MAP3K TRAFs-binding domain